MRLHSDETQKKAADCIQEIDRETNNKKIKGNDKKRLTLEGLSGAFLVLDISYSIAIAAFIVKVVHGCMRKRDRNGIDGNELKLEVRVVRPPIKNKDLKVKKAAIEIKSEPLVVQPNVSIIKETEHRVVQVAPESISEIKKNPINHKITYRRKLKLRCILSLRS